MNSTEKRIDKLKQEKKKGRRKYFKAKKEICRYFRTN